ncbi:zinc-binding protein [Fusarium tjaetaba]|uniref:Zinc-binding protein n=1 Tax=Fusarium tjaetaba TaxID=1567544 RepID=A0A8H5RI71_9HYPO|nr:zinc-binding protein [Fusarium tjaetaba]KAF5632947.1 zinc-binding protein [Fusarium tjaetaba]
MDFSNPPVTTGLDAQHVTTKGALLGGKKAFGAWQMLPGANVSRVLARSGVDWVLVDCEHGNLDDGAMHDAVPAIAALGVSPIVRLPDMQGWMVKRALDSGAHGIVVPLLRTPEEARQLVQSAKFPPLGRRGFGSPIAPERFHPEPSFSEYLQQANDSLLTIVQIETKEALESIDEIAAVDGIDVLFIGPFDLGNALGHPIIEGVMATELKDAIAKILAAGQKAGKKTGVYCTGGEQAKIYADQGFDMMNVVTDYTSLGLVAKEQLSFADGSLAPARGKGLGAETTSFPSEEGCGKQFTDPDEKCEYHPGPPIFHEGQKGWKCCKPRVLTFDEFMDIPPCTTGTHSTTDKPPQLEEKPQQDDAALAQKIDALNAATPSRAPIPTAQHAPTPPPPAPESEDDDPSLEIADGVGCKRRACGATYKKGSSRDDEECVHHPGVPIFHEGSKGYSCCKRRVLEFDQFMKIEGCKTKNRHLFVGSGKKDGANSEEVVSNVRHDFYQTPVNVIASFFLKKIDKSTAKIELQPKQLNLDLTTTDSPPKRYTAEVPLYASIDPEKSSYRVLGTKLEFVLAKSDGTSWPVLRGDEALTGEILQVGRAGRA